MRIARDSRRREKRGPFYSTGRYVKSRDGGRRPCAVATSRSKPTRHYRLIDLDEKSLDDGLP